MFSTFSAVLPQSGDIEPVPTPSPKQPWNSLFGNVSAQGKQFDKNPFSQSNQYYAFLAKVEEDESTTPKTYDVLFEVVPQEWMENVILSAATSIKLLAPLAPGSLYHVRDVDETTILNALGLKTTDDLAEGSWYLLTLTKKSESDVGVTGDLYDPDIDMEPTP
jgi:hypothetical protein